MDEHNEKEANKFQESPAGRREQDQAEAEDNTKEPMGDGEGYKAAVDGGGCEEEPTVQLKEVVSSSVEEEEEEEEDDDSSLFAHPCSLLRLLLRACAGCLGLHGYCTDPKPPPAADAGVAASPSQEGRAGGGEKANEVVARVWAVGRRPRPPDRPREGSGGNGGVHH
ncbi:hypothetical protein ACP4OV_026173 [Aristida adscensionis]